MINAKKGALLAVLLLLPARLHAAPPQFQLDLKELERQKQPSPSRPSPGKAPKSRKQAPAKKEAPAKASATTEKARSAEVTKGEYVRYTVRPGDHIFKILMTRFGLSNEQAERLIPSIVEVNGIRNIKTLEVGRTLLIPAAATGHVKEQAKEVREGKKAEPPRAPEPAAAPPEAPLSKPAPVHVPGPTPAPAPNASPSR